jgi:hypothetical protein
MKIDESWKIEYCVMEGRKMIAIRFDKKRGMYKQSQNH